MKSIKKKGLKKLNFDLGEDANKKIKIKQWTVPNTNETNSSLCPGTQ